MIVFIWLLNFVISILNAWGCGRSWTESKAVGGFAYLLNWCVAIMAACGFSWCYMVILGSLGATIPIEHDVDGKTITAPYFNQEDIAFLFNLGWSILIIPVIGSGIAITVNSWAVWWRTRTFGSTAEAAYNTFAMYHNIYSAVAHSGEVSSGISSYLGKSSSDDNKSALLMYLLVFAVLGGILTTYWIIRATQKSAAKEFAVRYEMCREY